MTFLNTLYEQHTIGDHMTLVRKLLSSTLLGSKRASRSSRLYSQRKAVLYEKRKVPNPHPRVTLILQTISSDNLKESVNKINWISYQVGQ